MSEAKEWEDNQCNENPCPAAHGRDIECSICMKLRQDGFRAGVRWVHQMFETNMKNVDPPFDVHAEVEKELFGS